MYNTCGQTTERKTIHSVHLKYTEVALLLSLCSEKGRWVPSNFGGCDARRAIHGAFHFLRSCYEFEGMCMAFLVTRGGDGFLSFHGNDFIVLVHALSLLSICSVCFFFMLLVLACSKLLASPAFCKGVLGGWIYSSASSLHSSSRRCFLLFL